MRFLALLNPYAVNSSAGDFTDICKRQREASQVFPSLVEDSPFNYWRLGDPILQTGERILIGVGAGFHMPNLRLLDLMCDSIESLPFNSLRIDVFDLSDMEHENLVQEYFPEFVTDLASQFPIVGVWNDGKHGENFAGYHASKYLLDKFGIGITTKELFDSVRPPSKEMMED